MPRHALRVPRPASDHTQSQPGPRRAPSCSPPPPWAKPPTSGQPSLPSVEPPPQPACPPAVGPHTAQARVLRCPPLILGHRFAPFSSWEPRRHPFPALCRASFRGPHPTDRFDIYRKVPKDLTQPTYTGAIISICCCLFILFLFLSELTGFITTEVVNELYVDDPDKDSGGKIDVSLNISLPNLHCELVGLDIQDEMGRHEVGHIDNSMKIPLNNGVGCRFEGQFSINKVPGNFHVSTHSATAQPQNPDMTHIIHKLSFGDTLQVQNVHGAFNALGGADRLTSNPLASHDYILKIVPTVYEDKSGKQRYSYQYTVANKEYVAYSHTGRIIPAIWFRYDLSPITVKYTERRQPLYRFITTICAIIGGTFTVAGILDSCIFTASEAWKKIQLGKMH
ncbi:endoplasmic reticulum-Golgi intermediate compartment protein 1 isoform X1 [Sturnira hondurensis]|uniref:endoplasmic reticulum-Golgi intermediate compartment protein 1 isoform X1 n=1 Tax=Sturnira hondurensis TaxID=192404 RepID=UPI001879CF57|nr:endoplasmic reticulum-Golgi intermediate compartment protein 1 isoform X1 [Sturnira hondurensis]